MSARSIRPATREDIPALDALVQSAYRGDASRAGWTTEADLLGGIRTDRAALTEIVESPATDALILVVVADEPDGSTGGVPGMSEGAPIACCHLERRDGGIAYFGMFAVRPTLQANGIGRVLLTAAQDHAAAHWWSRVMEMTVIAQRADLIAWYERRGYAPTGEVRPFPYGDARFGDPMRDDLELAVLQRPLKQPG